MGRRCTICDHPKREAIDKALVDTEAGYRSVAKRFGISDQALFRHRKEHLPALLRKALAAKPRPVPRPPTDAPLTEKEERHALDIVAQLRAINAACLEVLTKARASGNDPTLLRAVDRIHRQIDLQARLLGDLQDSKLQVAVGAGAQVVVLIPDNGRGDSTPHRREAGVFDLEASPRLGDEEAEEDAS